MFGYILGMTLGSIVIISVMAYLLFLFAKNKQFRANIKRIGTTAENQINDDIKTWAKHTKNYFIPNSLYKYSENKVFEIDSVLVTDKALIIIEIKSIKGRISGDANSLVWHKNLGEIKHVITNPVIQNDKHIEHIIKASNIKVPTVSLIIFSNRATSIDITNIPEHVVITKHSELFNKLDEINRVLPVYLTDYDMKTVVASIKSFRSSKKADINLFNKITKGGK